jgi:hypothetical protein
LVPEARCVRDSNFHLNKWYMDCVGADGHAVILYAATLRWGPLRLNFGATIVAINGVISERATMRVFRPPRLNGGLLEWRYDRLGVEGSWRSIDPAVRSVLLRDPHGDVGWFCEIPRGEARIKLGDGREVRGLGYAERLELTLRPWRLPIEQLRWGRVLTPENSVVWIQWLGPEPRLLIAHNGRQVAGRDVTDDGVMWEGGSVELCESEVLRRGKLGETVLARAPVRWITPRAVRGMSECKWLSRGRVRLDAGGGGEGWAIHEVVGFGGGGT